MLNRLKSINFFLLIGVLLLLFPFLTYVVALFVKARDNSALVMWFLDYMPIDKEYAYLSIAPFTDEYRNEIYFNLTYYLAMIILAMVLFVSNFGKEITRVICIVAAIVALLQLTYLACDGVLLLKRGIDYGINVFKLFMKQHAVVLGLGGYLFIFAGLIMSWIKPKQKRCKVEALQ